MASESIPAEAEAEPEPASEVKPIDDSDIVELERIIELAEDIQEHMDSLRTRRVFPGLGFLTGVAGILISLNFLTDMAMTVAAACACGIVALLGLGAWVSLVTELQAERRSLEEVLDVAREVEQGLAASGELRPLTRARLRIRLSRFRLGGIEMNPAQLLAKTVRLP